MFEYPIRLMRIEVFRLIAEKKPMLWTDCNLTSNAAVAKELQSAIEVLQKAGEGK